MLSVGEGRVRKYILDVVNLRYQRNYCRQRYTAGSQGRVGQRNSDRLDKCHEEEVEKPVTLQKMPAGRLVRVKRNQCHAGK